MAGKLGLELFIKATDKSKRMKAPLIRGISKYSNMTEDDYHKVWSVIQRHVSEINKEIELMQKAGELTSPPADGV